MNVTQVYSLVNSITSEILGESAVLKEDLSNVVDVGKELFSVTDVDNYTRKLIDRIGKVIFADRVYTGTIPNVLMDSWEYGAVVEKISCDLPTAIENPSFELTDGQEYSQDIFHKPSVSAKFFNNKVTFEIDISITERQVKESFASATELNAFISMIVNAVTKSFTIKTDGLIQRTINNMIAETLLDTSETKGNRAVNLLKLFNTKFGKTETVSTCITNPDFIKFSSYIMGLYVDRLSNVSTLFNIGGKDRFTNRDNLNIILLSDFKNASDVYLQSDVKHNELTALPQSQTVAYWQGSGKDFSFESNSTIDVTNASGTIKQSGILGVMFDRDSLGVSNLNTRVTTSYNAKAEFWNNYYKMDMGSFNDTNENFVVFYVADDPAKSK